MSNKKRLSYLENRERWLTVEIRRVKDEINDNYNNTKHLDSDISFVVRSYRNSLKELLKKVYEDMREISIANLAKELK